MLSHFFPLWWKWFLFLLSSLFSWKETRRCHLLIAAKCVTVFLSFSWARDRVRRRSTRTELDSHLGCEFSLPSLSMDKMWGFVPTCLSLSSEEESDDDSLRETLDHPFVTRSVEEMGKVFKWRIKWIDLKSSLSPILLSNWTQWDGKWGSVHVQVLHPHAITL